MISLKVRIRVKARVKVRIRIRVKIRVRIRVWVRSDLAPKIGKGYLCVRSLAERPSFYMTRCRT
jgi:hypothetical protein